MSQGTNAGSSHGPARQVAKPEDDGCVCWTGCTMFAPLNTAIHLAAAAVPLEEGTEGGEQL